MEEGYLTFSVISIADFRANKDICQKQKSHKSRFNCVWFFKLFFFFLTFLLLFYCLSKTCSIFIVFCATFKSSSMYAVYTVYNNGQRRIYLRIL